MNAEYVKRVLFNNEVSALLPLHQLTCTHLFVHALTHLPFVLACLQMVLMQNPPENATTTLVPGVARGKLVGGNLSLFVALLGTPWFPIDLIPWEQYILFLEDVGEEPYHIDRMLTTIHLSGMSLLYAFGSVI
jgi:muramoyltetrapeptide carboxypeptidase LdcA involved in peptidoglycan recycling